MLYCINKKKLKVKHQKKQNLNDNHFLIIYKKYKYSIY